MSSFAYAQEYTIKTDSVNNALSVSATGHHQNKNSWGDSFSGKLKPMKVTGQILLADVQADSQLEITIDLSELEEKLDEKAALIADKCVLDIKKFPTIKFVSSKIEHEWDGEYGSLRAKGFLMMHGERSEQYMEFSLEKYTSGWFFKKEYIFLDTYTGITWLRDWGIECYCNYEENGEKRRVKIEKITLSLSFEAKKN